MTRSLSLFTPAIFRQCAYTHIMCVSLSYLSVSVMWLVCVCLCKYIFLLLLQFTIFLILADYIARLFFNFIWITFPKKMSLRFWRLVTYIGRGVVDGAILNHWFIQSDVGGGYASGAPETKLQWKKNVTYVHVKNKPRKKRKEKKWNKDDDDDDDVQKRAIEKWKRKRERERERKERQVWISQRIYVSGDYMWEWQNDNLWRVVNISQKGVRWKRNGESCSTERRTSQVKVTDGGATLSYVHVAWDKKNYNISEKIEKKKIKISKWN